MNLTRRDLLATSAAMALASSARPTFAQSGDDFDIDAAFATFMSDLGADAGDGGGTVTFIGRDPILHSHFRIGDFDGASRDGRRCRRRRDLAGPHRRGQDIVIDLREAVYNVNPIITPVMQQRMAMGALPPNDPVATRMTFTPTVNGGSRRRRLASAIRSPLFRSAPATAFREHHGYLSATCLTARFAFWLCRRRVTRLPERSRNGMARPWRRRCSRPAS